MDTEIDSIYGEWFNPPTNGSKTKTIKSLFTLIDSYMTYRASGLKKDSVGI